MTDLLVVYSDYHNDWQGALLWAKSTMTKVKVIKERCYKGLDHRATHVYSTNEAILKDYSRTSVEIVSV